MKYNFFILICIGFLSCIDNEKEIFEIQNYITNEKIYFIRYEWGNDEATLITLNKDEENSYYNINKTSFVSNGFSPFYYKMSNDSLYIYGSGFKEPELNKFITKIKFINIDNAEYITISENQKYKKMGLSIFPEKEKKRLEYVDSLDLK